MTSLWRSLTGSGSQATPSTTTTTTTTTAAVPQAAPQVARQPVDGGETGYDQLDFRSFAQGQHITLEGTKLVRADLVDRMRAMAGRELMVVSRDAKGVKLVAPKGDFSDGVLMVDAASKAVGFWLPEGQWQKLPHSQRPTTAIEIDGQQFIRLDLTERIHAMVTQGKHLKIIGDYHGFHLMADSGDLNKGLLMVDKQLQTEGFWIPKWEYDRRG